MQNSTLQNSGSMTLSEITARLDEVRRQMMTYGSEKGSVWNSLLREEAMIMHKLAKFFMSNDIVND